MKRIIYLILLIIILSTTASALKIINTEEIGKNPDFYYTTIVFETDESAVNADLNKDGDMKDTVIRYYDIETREAINIEIAGKNPSVFAFYIVFESNEAEQNQDLNSDGDMDDTVIVYYHLRDKKLFSTTAIGYDPSLHIAELIAFSTPESEMGVDYNNDGDQGDNIVRYYNIATKEVVNTKQVGINPEITDKYILFDTAEAEIEEDLNKDKDTDDLILRFYSLETGKTVNTLTSGSSTEISKDHIAAFALNGNIRYYDVPSQKLTDTEIKGTEPSTTGKLIAFSRNNKLAVYDTEKNVFAATEITGRDPVISEDKIAFVSEQKIGYAISENLDNDTVLDFVDNCMIVENENQKDSNNNGIGDACDKEEPVKKQVRKEPVKTEQTPVQEENKTDAAESEEDSSSNKWLLILAIIAVSAGFLIYKIIMHRKKVRGFGF